MNPPLKPFKVFISYSRKDARHLKTLETHLSTLQRQGWIDAWTDRQFLPGDIWEPELLGKLRASDLVLLLVSADFNASDYIQDEELPRILERDAKGQVRLVPIFVRHADLKGTPLERVQCLPLRPSDRSLRPIRSWRRVDEAWLSVVHDLRSLLEALAHPKDPGPQQSDPTLERQLAGLGDALHKNVAVLSAVLARAGLEAPAQVPLQDPVARIDVALERARAGGREAVRRLVVALCDLRPGAVVDYLE